MDCGSPAWQPWLSNTNMARMEKFQNRVLSIAIGQLVSTPTEALRPVANISNYITTSNQNVLKAKEKSLRSSANHPKRIEYPHSNIPGNDLADRAAKQANELPSTADLPIAFSSALNVIKKVTRDPTIAHDQTREIYTYYRPSIDAVPITRQEDE